MRLRTPLLLPPSILNLVFFPRQTTTLLWKKLISKMHRWRGFDKNYQTNICQSDWPTKIFLIQTILSFLINLKTAQMVSTVCLVIFHILIFRYFLCPGNVWQLRFSDQIVYPWLFVIETTCSFLIISWISQMSWLLAKIIFFIQMILSYEDSLIRPS